MKSPSSQVFTPESTAIIVLAHRRTDHLLKVLDSISHARDTERCRLIFACDRPSNEVQEIIYNFSHPNKSMIVLNDAPLSTAHAINRSLYVGMKKAFDDMGCSAVVVIEDDILVSVDFLSFVLNTFKEYSSKKTFRGINLFSRTFSDLLLSQAYVMGNYGLGWGWAIDSQRYRTFLKFWTGAEDDHWDFIFEPYCRTGFVVNSFFSRVQSIGADETATHAGDDAAKIVARDMSISFSCLKDSAHKSFVLTYEIFAWNQDYYQFRKSNLASWFSAILLANLIYKFFGNSTGDNKVTSFIHSRLKRMYRLLGRQSFTTNYR